MTELFIVYGVPRSGTTALAQLLNAHPNVFCGIERFPVDRLSRRLLNAAGVLDQSIPSAHFERNVTNLQSKPEVLAFGDKTPRYYFSSRRLDREMPELKRIVIARQFADVMSSWQSRADNTDDHAWHRGQHGLFAILDYLTLIDSLAALRSPENCFLCSYLGMFGSNRNKNASQELFAFLGVGYVPEVEGFFDKTRNIRRSLAAKNRTIGRSDRDLLKHLRIDQLTRFIDERDGFARLADFGNQIQRISLDTPDILPRLTDSIDQRVAESPIALDYLIQVLRRMYTTDRQNWIFASDRSSYANGFRTTVNYVEASVQGDRNLAIGLAKHLRRIFASSAIWAPELDGVRRSTAAKLPRAAEKKATLGFVDSIMSRSVIGWVALRDSADPVTVELRIDGAPVQSQVADLPRPGLKSRNLHQTGRCGFHFALNEDLDKTQDVEVVVFPGGKSLGMHQSTIDQRRAKSTPELKMFFLHIPKTAGSSLNDFIASHFDANRVKTHIESVSYRHNPQVSEDYDFISGHIKAPEAKRWLNLDGFAWATLFRYPWNQLASHLSWVRFVGEDPQGAFFKGHPKPIRDLALKLQSIDYSDASQLGELLFSDDHRVLTLFDNFQTRALVEIKSGERVSRSILELAMERLDWFNVLGTTEDYDRFIERLCSFAGWERPPKNKRLNIQPRRYGLDVDNKETKAALAPLVEHDLELYDLIRQRISTEN